MSTEPRPGGARTAYLPAERSGPLQLAHELDRASRSPIVEALLVGSGAALGVLNEHRELLAINAAYLELLGARSPADALGLRPGEAVGCVHAEAPGGCGTTPACAGCGAAIALLVATRRGRPAERDCALRVERAGRTSDHVFRVRAAPLEIEGAPLFLFTVTDVGVERRRAALQRAFLHDVGNLAVGLESAAAALGGGAGAAPDDPPLAEEIRLLAGRLVREVTLQRALAAAGGGFRAAVQRVPLARALAALCATLQHHPAAEGRRLELDAAAAPPLLDTDPVLLEHVLSNLLLNALEASRRGGVVRLALRQDGDAVAFRVWNDGAVPAAVRPRIFQRYFTTKGEGRGQGTYAARLFAETCLGGEVSFRTSAREGTTFEVRLPLRPRGS